MASSTHMFPLASNRQKQCIAVWTGGRQAGTPTRALNLAYGPWLVTLYGTFKHRIGTLVIY